MFNPTYVEAILSLEPNAKFVISNNSLGSMDWQDESITRPSDEDIETELKKVTWKKSMKCGNNNLRWARPLKNILCLYDNKKLSFSFKFDDINFSLNMKFLYQILIFRYSFHLFLLFIY